MWLTLATFVGYAVIYTVLLKPATPQNIVIGGASGAMPPVLGWAAVANDVAPEALLLFLIIFAWTPPHFWALALYRTQDYAKAGLPMLPVTHGSRYTRLMIVLYTVALVAVSLLPFAIRMSGVTLSRRSVGVGRRVPCLLGSPVRPLQRRSGARDVPLLDRLSVRAVLRTSDRPLLAVNRGAAALVAVLLTLALFACSPEGPKFKASDVTGASFGRDFALTDHTGKPRTLADYRGKAVVVFFGFTQCPDVCPTTLVTLAQTMKLLGPDADRVQVCSLPSTLSATRPRCCRTTYRHSIPASSA